MEADWEVELDAVSPVIDAHWSGFVDLRSDGQRAISLPEVKDFPGLAVILKRLNGRSSPVWTSKSDIWKIDTADRQAFDPDELDAPAESVSEALSCYIDLLPGNDHLWETTEQVVLWCRRVCHLVHTVQLRNCRADMIVRRAYLAREDRMALGVTAYVTACGVNPEEAALNLTSALVALVDSISEDRFPAKRAT
jgi:hypothetical protein